MHFGGFILRLIFYLIVFIHIINTQWSHSVVVITSDFESENLGSTPGGTFFNRVAQWKRIGPITQGSEDRNLPLLCNVSIAQ